MARSARVLRAALSMGIKIFCFFFVKKKGFFLFFFEKRTKKLFPLDVAAGGSRRHERGFILRLHGMAVLALPDAGTT
jgi:hypothetical protein